MDLETAARVAQAQGIISVFDGCSLDEALARMSQCARRNDRTIRTVADIVIDRHTHVVLRSRARYAAS